LISDFGFSTSRSDRDRSDLKMDCTKTDFSEFQSNGIHGIQQQGSNRHGSYAAWNGCDVTAFWCDTFKVNVTFQSEATLLSCICYPCNADINYNNTLLHHFSSYKFRFTKSSNDDVCLQTNLIQVFGFAVTD